MRLLAERTADGPRERSVALLKAGGALLHAIESVLLEPSGLTRCEVLFFPSVSSHSRLLAHLARARRTCDVAMFTLTDDRIRDALLALHGRGVRVRVISDDETAMNT